MLRAWVIMPPAAKKEAGGQKAAAQGPAVGESHAKKARAGIDGEGKPTTRSPETLAKSHFGTNMRKTANGQVVKRSSMPERQQAQQTLDKYHSMGPDGKTEFALMFMQNKDKKDFNWVREFDQKVQQKKVEKEGGKEKYYTRTAHLCFSSQLSTTSP